MSKTATTLKVCTDCVQLLANGELTSAEGFDMTEAHGRRIDDHLGEGADITLGCTDPECLDDGDEVGFSWSRCDGCGSHLGGDRFHATLWTGE